MITKAILRVIAGADAGSIDRILEAVMRRKRELCPDWEVIYVAVPKENSPRRREMTEQIIRLLSKEMGEQNIFLRISRNLSEKIVIFSKIMLDKPRPECYHNWARVGTLCAKMR